jgi:hypothetical protein
MGVSKAAGNLQWVLIDLVCCKAAFFGFAADFYTWSLCLSMVCEDFMGLLQAPLFIQTSPEACSEFFVFVCL